MSLPPQRPADVSEPLAPTGGRFPGLDTVLAGPVGLLLLGVGPCPLPPPAPVGSARFLPDAAAASIGVGPGLLLAMVWRDALATVRGVPTGPAIHAGARRLDGAEARQGARPPRREHPLLHGVLVPLAHRVGRRRTGRTGHVDLVPDGRRTGRRA